MLQAYLASFAAMALAFVLTGAALHFARFKKRGGCCSHGLKDMGNPVHDCRRCSCDPGRSDS